MVARGVLPALSGALVIAVVTADGLAQPMSQSESVPRVAAWELEPLRLEYSAPNECPRIGVFLSRLLARSPYFRPAQANELARVIHVTLVRAGNEIVGEARLLRAGASRSETVLAIGSCDIVLGKLAQFAATAAIPARPDRGPLPENPYLNWQGPTAEVLPQNPYLRRHASVAANPWPEERLPENPYLNWRGPVSEALPKNPYLRPHTRYASTTSLPEEPLPENPYLKWQAPLPEPLPLNPYLRR
jgi:hypothetical protein